MSEQPQDDTVVEVPTTVVVTQDDGTAAAVAVEAEARSEMAAESAVAATESAEAANATAEAAATVSLSAHDELRAFRGEFGEVRPMLSELFQDLQERKQREAELADQAAQVTEVPVNESAKRDAENRSEDSGDDAAGTKQAPAPASDTPGQAPRKGGLRRRR